MTVAYECDGGQSDTETEGGDIKENQETGQRYRHK